MRREQRVAEDLEKPHWGNNEANLEFLAKTGLFDRPRSVLEIGSGKGEIVAALRRSRHRAVGIDVERDLVSESRARHRYLPALVGGAERLPFPDSSFEIVLSFDVFEHIRDSDRHLAEVRRVLAPGGRYLLQTPNKLTNVLFEPIRFSLKYGVSHAFRFLEHPHHCSLHTFWQLKRRFEGHGFEVRFYDVPVVNDFFRDKIRRFLGRPGLLALRVFDPDRLPLPLRTNFFVESRMG